MKIGIIGTGKMGTGLGKLWAKAGHEVFFGSRDSEKAQAQAALIDSGARGGSLAHAAEFGEAVLLAFPYAATSDALEMIGPLHRKIVIDCTNPVVRSEDGMGLAYWGTSSGAEEIARALPGALVVKAFNHIYSSVFSSSRQFDSQRATLFFCGDDEKAKAAVAQLAEDVELEPIDVGPLSMARCLEPFALLMIQLQFHPGMSSEMAVKLLRRQALPRK